MRFLGLSLLFLFIFQLSTAAKAFACLAPGSETPVMSFEGKQTKIIISLASELSGSSEEERVEITIEDDDIEPLVLVSFCGLSPIKSCFPFPREDFHLAPHLSRLLRPPKLA